MVYQKGGGLLCQAMLDAVQYPDNLFYLPINPAIANGDMVMYDPQPLSEPCKADHKLSAVVCLDVAQLVPVGNHIIVQEFSGPIAVQQGHSVGLHPLENGSMAQRYSSSHLHPMEMVLPC